MERVDYLSKRYHRFVDDISLNGNDGPNILIALNGASRRNLNAITSDILRAVKKPIHVPRNFVDTESSLSRIFTEARNNKEVVFFDEADALFGKRTNVKDAHDKYANIATSSLLKSIDEHNGVVILASRKRKTLNSSLLSKVDILILFPPFSTIIRRVLMNLTRALRATR